MKKLILLVGLIPSLVSAGQVMDNFTPHQVRDIREFCDDNFQCQEFISEMVARGIRVGQVRGMCKIGDKFKLNRPGTVGFTTCIEAESTFQFTVEELGIGELVK